jgi:hypothetical protein
VWLRYSRETERSIVSEASNLKRRADEQRKAFKEAHGYPAHLIPDIWVGQDVAMNTLGGSSLVLANGTLEAVTPEGFVLSNELGRIVFIPREAVVQMELYDPNRSDTGVDF